MESFLCNIVRMSYLWETFSSVCKVSLSHNPFLHDLDLRLDGAWKYFLIYWTIDRWTIDRFIELLIDDVLIELLIDL